MHSLFKEPIGRQTHFIQNQLPPFFPEILCLEDCALCVNDHGVGESASEDAKVRVEL